MTRRSPKSLVRAEPNWEQNGWKVDVRYKEVGTPIHPKSYIDRIRPLLPAKYSPLQESGDVLQSVYLAELSMDLANLLMGLLQQAGNDLQLGDLHRIEAG